MIKLSKYMKPKRITLIKSVTEESRVPYKVSSLCWTNVYRMCARPVWFEINDDLGSAVVNGTCRFLVSNSVYNKILSLKSA